MSVVDQVRTMQGLDGRAGALGLDGRAGALGLARTAWAQGTPGRWRISRAASASLFCGAVFVAPSCVDAESSFDAFFGRCQASHTAVCTPSNFGDGAGGGPCHPPAADALDGDFLMAVATTLGPDKPTLFDVVIDATQDGDRVALTLTVTALDATTHQKVGKTSDPQLFYIEPDGKFVVDLPAKDPIPGEANAVLPGMPVTADTHLESHICVGDEDESCGTAKMVLISPALGPADGTFGLRRITGSTLPTPLVRCAVPDAGTDAAGPATSSEAGAP